jgi:hypothetical protein
MSDPIATLASLIKKETAVPPEQSITLLDSRRVRRANKPPTVPPALKIGKIPIAKPGDITVISAQAKSGKTAFVNGIIAAAICAETGEMRDTFGVEAAKRPENGVIVWIDTEQSEEDAWANLDRAGRRAGCDDDPEWIRAYHLVGEAPLAIRAAIQAEIKRVKLLGFPIWFVVVDGITDLCNDPNNIEEAQEVCTEARALARDASCPFICVIHRNEGEKAGADARGHVGKELNRKAAVVLSLERDSDDITTVWTHKSRGAPVKKEEGPRFKWSDRDQMHVSVQSAAKQKANDQKGELRRMFEGVFGQAETMNYQGLLAGMTGIAEKTKQAKVTDGINYKIINRIRKDTYVLMD